MLSNSYLRRTVILYIAIYTVFITVLAAAAGRGDISYVNLLWIIPISVYTAKMIVQRIADAIERRSKGLNQLADSLHAMSANLNKYAKELEQRANILNERHIVIKDQVDKINQFSRLISEVFAKNGNMNKAASGTSYTDYQITFDTDDYNAG